MSNYNNSDFYNPDRGWRTFNRNEIVDTPNQPNRWVPNVGDLIWDEHNGWFIVRYVEPGTHVSTLETWDPVKPKAPITDSNQLVGVGPGYSSESYRMFLDTSVTPFTFTPSRRLRSYGSMVTHYQVFLGSDISPTTGTCISAFYTPTGDYLGPSVPFETEVIPGANVQTIKIPMGGYTVESLKDGELVTLVSYSDEGGVVDVTQLLVQNTAAISQSDASKSYVGGISLDSPFLSSSDPKVIEFPLNVTVQSLPMAGVVHYRGGRKTTVGIDNLNMFLFGLNDYIATEVGQEFPLTLAYQLKPDEVSYELVPTALRRLTATYTARTVAADNAYECRLFVYPTWVNEVVGYRLEFWLYNLDRQRFYNVSPYVELGVNSPPFNPKSYGVLQTLTYSLNLNQVDGRFAPHRLVSSFQVALLSEGSNRKANWEVYPRPNTGEAYGRNLKADIEYLQTNMWDLRLANGASTKEAWLRKMYEAAEPLINPAVEVAPLTPTHFVLHFLHNKYEFSVEQWNQKLRVNNDLADGELLNIQWIRRIVSEDLQLAMTALPILQRA